MCSENTEAPKTRDFDFVPQPKMPYGSWSFLGQKCPTGAIFDGRAPKLAQFWAGRRASRARQNLVQIGWVWPILGPFWANFDWSHLISGQFRPILGPPAAAGRPNLGHFGAQIWLDLPRALNLGKFWGHFWPNLAKFGVMVARRLCGVLKGGGKFLGYRRTGVEI